MNKVFLVGRFASDPQQFVTQNGITQSRINIACSDNWNKNETYFFPCIAWQSTANFINNYLKKGDLVAVDGKLIRRSYVSKEGKTVYVTEIVIENIRPLGSKNQNSQSQTSDFKSSVSKSSMEFLPDDLVDRLDSQSSSEMFDDSIKMQNKIVNDDPFSEDGSEEDVVDLDWMKELNS